MEAQATILTAGYGGGSFDDLARRLKTYDVKLVVDVRSYPTGKGFNADFSKKRLEELLGTEAIDYRHERDLGAENLKGQYARPKIMAAVERVKDKALDLRRRSKSVCLLCMEKDPDKCHRKQYLPAYFAYADCELMHIDQRGELVASSQRDLMPPELDRSAQLPLV